MEAGGRAYFSRVTFHFSLSEPMCEGKGKLSRSSPCYRFCEHDCGGTYNVGTLERRFTTSMRFAIFGDIHGNMEALQAVLADAEALEGRRIMSVSEIS